LKKKVEEDKQLILEAKRREGEALQERNQLDLEKKQVEEEKKKAVKEKKKAERKIDQINEQKLCVVCLERERGLCFEPCGHICCCQECGKDLDRCPVDNEEIRNRQKAYPFV